MTSDNEFLNPYNFIPVKKPGRTEDASAIAVGHHPRIRHDAWQSDALHGCIHCTLKAETPLIIGGSYSREDEKQSTPTVQHPYRRKTANGAGKLAVPGNSLRGMIGSTLEALSNSALRVLEDSRYSVRKKFKKVPVPKSLHEFFQSIDDDLQPWSGDRKALTPAEALLGVVAEGVDGNDCQLPALASRVRFRDAVLKNTDQDFSADGVLGKEVKLQILGAPKPPSPRFYFRNKKNASSPVEKHQLVQPDAPVLARGRKWYLHHRPEEVQNSKWESNTGAQDKGNKQRICARPIIPGTRFCFTVEFTNLSSAELELLCVALRPSESYRHKLGLGKPLGLGTVDIAIDGISIQQRDFSAYFRDSLDGDKLSETNYESLKDLLDEQGQDAREPTLVDKEIRGILETIGNPENVELPVCYPRSQAQLRQWKQNSGAQEEKLFEWFVNNDSETPPQALAPVEKGKPLKGLRANFKKKKTNRRR